MYQVSHTSDDSYMYFVLQIILVNVHMFEQCWFVYFKQFQIAS